MKKSQEIVKNKKGSQLELFYYKKFRRHADVSRPAKEKPAQGGLRGEEMGEDG